LVCFLGAGLVAEYEWNLQALLGGIYAHHSWDRFKFTKTSPEFWRQLSPDHIKRYIDYLGDRAGITPHPPAPTATQEALGSSSTDNSQLEGNSYSADTSSSSSSSSSSSTGSSWLAGWYYFEVSAYPDSKRIGRALRRLGGLPHALRVAYPHHQWDTTRLLPARRPAGTKLAQRAMASAMQKLCPNYCTQYPHFPVFGYFTHFCHLFVALKLELVLRAERWGGSAVKFDCLVEDLGLVVEYHGPQHYFPSWTDSMKESYLELEKVVICAERGWRYFVVPFWWSRQIPPLANSLHQFFRQSTTPTKATALPFPEYPNDPAIPEEMPEAFRRRAKSPNSASWPKIQTLPLHSLNNINSADWYDSLCKCHHYCLTVVVCL